MQIPLDAPEILNREFLQVRAKLLEVAASLDRLERAEGQVSDDPRLAQVYEGLAALAHASGGEGDSRAERIQMIFSLPYQPDWKQEFGLCTRPIPS